MSLSKILISTIKKEKAAVFLYMLSTASIMLFYYLLYDKTVMLYPFILAATFLVCYLTYKFFVYRKLYIFLKEGKQSPQYKVKSRFVFEDILKIIGEVHNNYLEDIYNIRTKYENRDKLLAECIHNIKTSVAVIELATEKGNGDIIKDIAEENKKIAEKLESTLNIFRLQSFEKDYVLERVDIKELITAAINSKKKNFIYSGIFPKVDVMEREYIYTDKKWSKYVIEQIITNAIKYSTKGKSILFYTEYKEDCVILCIEDKGTGIKKQELKRVFDAFYTGSNGRVENKSSGIGLYMCKTICDMLSSEISIESEESKGTIVRITFQGCKL